MYKFAILSIPHTGTHFVFKLLGGSGEMNMNEVTKYPEAEIYVGHIYKITVFERLSQAGFQIVVPMRHPLTTVSSWVTWEDTIDHEYTPEVKQYANSGYVPQLYRNLIMADQLYDIDYIPVDSPYKHDFLRAFNRKHNKDYVTQWKPENSIQKEHLSVPRSLVEDVAMLMDENREFFERFYKVDG